MKLSELLAYLGDTTRFPFMGGFVAPKGSNPTKTVDGIVLDIMTADTDHNYRAYYRRINGIRADTTPVSIRVVDEGLPTEAAYIASLATPGGVQSTTLIPLWTIAELGRTAGWWYGVKAAAAAETPNPYAVAFMDYYEDRRFDNLDKSLPAVTTVLAGLASTGLLTEEQAAAVSALPTTAPTDFS